MGDAKPSGPRILFSGDVNGQLAALYKRVVSVNKSNGPFDCLFCVGSFFPSSNIKTEGKETAIPELEDYVNGIKSIPLLTYVIGDFGEGSEEVLEAALEKSLGSGNALPGIEICANLRWLRGAGTALISGEPLRSLSHKICRTLNPDPDYKCTHHAFSGAHLSLFF